MGKPIYKSKTFWVAILTILLGIVEWLNGQMATGASISIIGVLNIILRLVTKEATSLIPE